MMRSSEILTKEQILTTAEDTLRRFGTAKTSVTDIAKALNVSHGTIYRHFKNKAELMEAATEKWLHEKIIASLSLIYEEKGKHGPEHLKKYIQRLIELKRSYAHQDKELFEMYAKVTEESSELIEKHITHITNQMSEIIKQSEIKASDPEGLAHAIFYATARFHHPAHAYEWAHPSIDQEFSEVWTLLEKGFLTNK